VDGADFLELQRGYGTLYDASHLADWETNFGSAPVTSDVDNDGDVDGADFLELQRGYGTIYEASDLDAWAAAFGQGTTNELVVADGVVSSASEFGTDSNQESEVAAHVDALEDTWAPNFGELVDAAMAYELAIHTSVENETLLEEQPTSFDLAKDEFFFATGEISSREPRLSEDNADSTTTDGGGELEWLVDELLERSFG